MGRKWLILDSPFLCHRAFHAGGGMELSYGDQPTGVLFGYLRELTTLKSIHQTDCFVHTFDGGWGLRERVNPQYKSLRRNKHQTASEEEKDQRSHFRQQIKKLRDEILPELGYANIFHARGYEADDVIAKIVQDLPPGDEAVIVASDQDLYQLLSPRVSMWKPVQKAFYTEASLAREFFGLPPIQWVQVKAIAGCTTDSLPGVPGVGEITAAKFIRGKLKEDSKAYQVILANEAIWKANLPLVRLPYEGCPPFPLRDGVPSPSKWREVLDRFGMKSLLGRI